MVLSIVILCTGNSARSQIGEAILRKVSIEGGEESFKVFSAGTRPLGRVHPLAIKVMEEAGYDMSAARSKNISEYDGHTFDVVITVCGNANETCPLIKANIVRYHWGFEDPSSFEGTEDEKLEAFRATRDAMVALFEPYGRDLAEGNCEPTEFHYEFMDLSDHLGHLGERGEEPKEVLFSSLGEDCN